MFQYMKDEVTGAILQNTIKYTDPAGRVWCVPDGHRIWIEVYEPWLAAGNTPAAA